MCLTFDTSPFVFLSYNKIPPYRASHTPIHIIKIPRHNEAATSVNPVKKQSVLHLTTQYRLFFILPTVSYQASPLRISSMRIAETGIRVPGPKMAATPAL